jgi:hypothetical protein
VKAIKSDGVFSGWRNKISVSVAHGAATRSFFFGWRNKISMGVSLPKRPQIPCPNPCVKIQDIEKRLPSCTPTASAPVKLNDRHCNTMRTKLIRIVSDYSKKINKYPSTFPETRGTQTRQETTENLYSKFQSQEKYSVSENSDLYMKEKGLPIIGAPMKAA